MDKLKLPVFVSAWFLFIFGIFCLIDGLVALLIGKPCWIVRLILGPIGMVLGSFLTFIKAKMERS